MAALASPVHASLDQLLHLADNALVLGQRNAEWCGNGPVLEEDIALANMSLDLIGQARMLYQHAATSYAPTLVASRASCDALPLSPETGAELARGGPSLRSPAGAPITEDSLAYFRDAGDFRNFTLLELPHASAASERDYAVTIVRNFLYSAFMLLQWEALQTSPDAQLAGIAGKSLKEVAYHFRHSRDWLIRLGDGTTESHQRTQAALNQLLPYTAEFWVTELATLRTHWDEVVNDALHEAGLSRPPVLQTVPPHGHKGQHSEHLAPLLAEMQSLARAHPQALW